MTSEDLAGSGGITVFLVDDHEIARVGVADLLEAEDDLTVIGQAASVREALARIPPLRPKVVVLDVRLPDGSGVELCRELRSRMPAVNCLMLTAHTDEQAKLDALLAGAAGYLLKDIKDTKLVTAVRTAGAGGRLLDARATGALVRQLQAKLDESAELPGLTGQERVLLDLIGQGLTNRQIAERMFLAEKTVKNYVSRLLGKLGVGRRTQAAVIATELHYHHRPHDRL
ncbi:response regulator transcription factor [Saccharopolyspora indica]|uniref:response regulator n=1 Tax=Saccharopolyspora indica TaxID=1229659 RepID=UPI0022EAE6F7|nr:response regulator transcription factor [Saccharopolyspora indica]MDA3644307.1 response regulator transcription factor [Saccharopolyspora indica]